MASRSGLCMGGNTVYVCVYIYNTVYIYMYVCMYVYMYICIYIYIYIYIHICIHTHTHTHTHTTHTHKPTHTHTHTHTHTYTYMYMYTLGRYSPVQSCLKFSAVRGHTSAYNCHGRVIHIYIYKKKLGSWTHISIQLPWEGYTYIYI